ncbi:MAG: LrgB family protein [Eubacteriales bacterium]|nr:LrgB family protein [Eubacteriales bacterium]
MNDVMVNCTYFGAFLTIAAFLFGQWCKKKWKFAICNPLLIAVIVIMLLLVVCDIDYDSYYEGAKYISYLLTPATVCLAIPLYQQLELLKKHAAAILVGVFSGAIASMAGILGLSILFGLTHEQYVTLLPKSITTAIGMGVSEELGGLVTITVAVIIMTGILGNVIASAVCRLFHIEEPIAKGLAIGTASHAIGTARALEIGQVEGAMSSLAVAVAGILTACTASLFAMLW